MAHIGGIAGDQLKSFIDRIESLNGELEDIKGDVSEIYMEAKAVGFDAQTIRRVIKERKMDAATREEKEQLFVLYMDALDGTPLGDWSKKKAA